MIGDLLDLAELYVKDRRFEEALKLFDPDAIKKLGPVEAMPRESAREQQQLAVLSGLGRGVVLAYQDRADESNARFQDVLRPYPPPKKDVLPKVPRAGAVGQLEQFFARGTAGARWKRAVGEAIDRNEKNLGKVPDDLKRLRMLPAKGKA